jgi:hypothetical protein
MYEDLRGTHPSPEFTATFAEPVEQDKHEAMGEFLASWIELERVARDLAPPDIRERGPVLLTSRVIGSIARLDDQARLQFERLRRMRNNLVHGIELPDPRDLREAAGQLDMIRLRLIAASAESKQVLRPTA